jgi:FHA domain
MRLLTAGRRPGWPARGVVTWLTGRAWHGGMRRWSVTVSACLMVFALTWWAWEALEIPPRGPDRLGVALAVAALLSTVAGLPLAAWAGRDTPEPPTGYLSRMSDRGAEDVYPIRPGEWLIGRSHHACQIVVPDEFPAAGKIHARLICDEDGFSVEGLHANGTYLQDRLIPVNVKQPVGYDQFISLAGPRGSTPEKCAYVLTRRPLPWPRTATTDNKGRSETMTVLALMADPAHGARLGLDRDLQAINEAAAAAGNGGQVLVKLSAADSLPDLGLELYLVRPSVLHISGIGGHEGQLRGIALPIDDSASAPLASAEELGDFFREKAPMVRCVVLNACYTYEQGLAISRQVACVIGTPPLTPDAAALAFTLALYQQLGDGRPIGEAFTHGKKAITRLIPPGKHAVPIIRTHPGTRKQCLT